MTTKTVVFAIFMKNVSYYNQDFLRLYDGAKIQMAFGTDIHGFLQVKRNATILETSTTVLMKERWNYIEVQTTINNSTGAYELKLNGTTVFSDTSVDTQESANTYWSGLTLRGIGDWDNVFFDDCYVTDTTGSYNTGFMGTIHIESIFPDADVTKEWTTSTGTDHYALVDENPADDDTSYVEDDTATNRELFDLPALSPTTLTIKGVTSILDARITDASTVDMKFVNVSNVTTTTSSSQTISSQSQARYEEIYEEDPDASAAWTKTTFEAAQFGFEVA